MLSRIGFLMLLLAFGLLAWVAGLVMPAGLLQQIPVPQALQAVLPPSLAARVAAPPAAPAPAAAPAGAAADKPAKAPPPLESLLVPTPAPEKGRYALQLGLYPGAEEAEALAARVNALRLPGVAAKTLQVRSQDGLDWWLAAAGEQATPEDLETARALLAERLGLQAIRPILLPAPTKP